MMIYETLLAIGALGLLLQLLLGLGHGHGVNAHEAHGGHLGHSNTPAAHGHAASHAGHGPAEHAHGQAEHGEQAQQREGGAGLSSLLAVFSPLTLFSLCVGAGATGLLVRPSLGPYPTALAALAGSIAFYGLLVRPLWSLMFQFASTPSRALEGAVAAPAEAMTRFDEHGRGMVRLNVDGQIVRILAHLEPDERKTGVVIRPGDQVVVTSVDPRANTCRVSRL